MISCIEIDFLVAAEPQIDRRVVLLEPLERVHNVYAALSEEITAEEQVNSASAPLGGHPPRHLPNGWINYGDLIKYSLVAYPPIRREGGSTCVTPKYQSFEILLS